ncbi:conserved domain protein [delta proteobacterium NaphS2]|nr:conserved domain protein [delta proteobacterium NaphS2]
MKQKESDEYQKDDIKFINRGTAWLKFLLKTNLFHGIKQKTQRSIWKTGLRDQNQLIIIEQNSMNFKL